MNRLIVFLILIASTSGQALADGWISLGSKSGHSTWSLGFKGVHGTLADCGVEIGIINDIEFNEEVLDYQIPHASYIDKGVKKTENTVGLDFLRFAEVNPSTRIYGGIGLYFDKKLHIAKSTATGWNYTQSDESSTLVAASFGIQTITSNGIALGAGVHSLRGFNVSLGKAF